MSAAEVIAPVKTQLDPGKVIARVKTQLDPGSESPVKPDSEAMEPNEDARCVPSPAPSSSAYDADQSDTGSEQRASDKSSMPGSGGLVTEQMVEEENKLKRRAELEEQRKKEERDMEWARLEEADKAQRFERLQHLLTRSNMYTEYLIARMKRQHRDDSQRRERRAKKLARKEEKRREEEEEAAAAARRETEKQSQNSNLDDSQGKQAEEPESGRNLRHKRKASAEAEKALKTPPAPKRRRTLKEASKATEDNKPDEVDGVPPTAEVQRAAVPPLPEASPKTVLTPAASPNTGTVVPEASPKTEAVSLPAASPNTVTILPAASPVTVLPAASPVTVLPAASPETVTLFSEALPMTEMEPEEKEERMFEGEVIPDKQPSMMTGGVLRPYQLEGFMWLRTLYENGVNGILADEMGLGKTVQCVAMMSHMVYMGVPGPFMVCAPLSTLPNWCNEFERFAPTVPVMLYHGSKEERKELREKIEVPHEVRPGVFVRTVVITSYEVAMMDQKVLQKVEWRYLAVDEGHRIKNTHCRLIKALRVYTSTNRLLLTGTPLQNNLAELWSLLNFLLPEIFDDLGSFEAWFDIEHIGEEMVADKQKKDVLSMLHQILTPFMLRRLKTDVDLGIPPKKEVIVYAPLRPLQKDFYAALIDRTIFAKIQQKNGTVQKTEVDRNGRPLRKAAKNKIDYSLMVASEREDKECNTSRRKAQEEEEIEAWVQAMVTMQQKREQKAAPELRVSQLTIKLRNVMMQLRKCCSHPFLLEHPLDKKTGELSLDERIITQSGKTMVLDRMLKELHKRGHKVLIFSQMTKMLDLLEDFCVLRKYGYCRLDGGMNIHDRRESMAEYQKADSDKFVFLLSTRAGGLGINLTAADTVIIYDSDWNPQCDLQAQDRCHRIGQTRPVMVYRLVTANTIDQRIVERAAAKRKLEKMVIHQGKFKSGMKNFKTSLEPISSEELLHLLNSKDHDSEVGGGTDRGQGVISDADLAELLDRSDLETKWKAKQVKAAASSDMSTEDSDTCDGFPSVVELPPPPPPPPTPSPDVQGGRRQSLRRPAPSKKVASPAAAAAPKQAVPKRSVFKVIDMDEGGFTSADV